MNDLISREAALDMKFSNGISEDGVLYVPYRELKMNLEELPSAQPEPDTALYADGFNDGYKQGKNDARPDLDEWCYTCSEYDQERHCCLRWNRVIRQAIRDAQPEIIRCKDCKHYDGRPCGIVDWYNTEDDFCSKGERRTDETD